MWWEYFSSITFVLSLLYLPSFLLCLIFSLAIRFLYKLQISKYSCLIFSLGFSIFSGSAFPLALWSVLTYNLDYGLVILSVTQTLTHCVYFELVNRRVQIFNLGEHYLLGVVSSIFLLVAQTYLWIYFLVGEGGSFKLF